MATWATLLADIRTSINRDGTDVQVTDASLLVQANRRYFVLRRILGDVVPTLYTKVAPTFSLTTTNTQDLTAAPVSLTDFGKIRRVEKQANGGSYFTIDVANPAQPEEADDIAFLERGNIIEIYPSTQPTGTYRVIYISKPTALVNPGDTVDVPEGAEAVIAQEVAAWARVRFEEDPNPHLQAARDALTETKSYLLKRYGVHVEGLRRTQ